MGLLFSDRSSVDVRARQEDALFQRLGCNICPLRDVSPGRATATGSKRPLILIIGEAPGKDEQRKASQFVGESGRLIRPRIPAAWLPDIRWTNTVHCRPPKNRTPERAEIECFPAGTLVRPVGELLAVYRRWYVGSLVKVCTASGKVLTGSPKHPVVTQRGLIGLGELVESDYLSCTPNSRGTLSGDPDVDNIPAPIEEVFSTLAQVGVVQRVHGAVVDFHGDGMEGQVDIVGAEGKLVAPCERGHAIPLVVELDPVVSVEFIGDFRGHLYNLHTSSGRYLANNILVSNCCRPRWQTDIEETKPHAIFGCGNVPLQAITGFTGITVWRGRRMPVRIGSHACWYYPMWHPSYLLRQRRGQDRDLDGTFIGSEDERMFVFDLNRALDEVDAGLPPPDVHDEKRARAGVETIMAGGREGVAKIRAALQWAAQQKAVGVDYETQGLRPYAERAKILTAAVATEKRAVAFPLGHREAQFNDAELQAIVDAWVKFLQSPVVKYVHNLAFEHEWTAEFFGPDLLRKSRWECSAVQASVIDERKGKSKPGCFSLEFLVQQYYGFNLKKLSPLKKEDMDSEPLPRVLEYNGMDSKYHIGLGLKQKQEIKWRGLESVYEDSLRRVPTVVLSQHRGVPVDQVVTARLHKKYSARVASIETKIQQVPVVKTFNADKVAPFSPASSKQVLEIFTKYLKRRECTIVDKYSGDTKYSTEEEVLEKVDHPLAPLVLDFRKAARNKVTYLEALMPGSGNCVLWPDGLLHTILNTYWAETGRLSSEEPNLQNFPKRDGEAVEVRQQVTAAAGEIILSLDLGQIEARVIAMFTKDPTYVKALWENYDIHMEWAERLARAYPDRIGGKKNLTDKKVMKDFRTDIKNQWTFPLFFGASLDSAAGYLSIPKHKLAPEYTAFWKQFTTTGDWQESQLKFYRKHGYVDCLTGRQRRGPLTANKVYNSPVQGTAAEIIMDRMCTMSEIGDPELQPELQIHDDLTFLRVKESRADEVAEKILDIMLDVRHFDWVNVPITVELAAGKNWAPYNEKTNVGGLKAIGTFSSHEWFP